MSDKSIKVFAPATVANVACGFDILGFAVNAPGDELLATLNSTAKVNLTKIHGCSKLPLDANLNSVTVAAQALLQYLVKNKRIDPTTGVEFELFKHMPLGSGLGSSAASSAAGVYALNYLLGQPLDKKELVQFAMQGEKIACGSAHADNVAPALLGGFILIRSYDPLDIIALPTPDNLHATVIHPHLELKTEDARKILKKSVPLSLAIKQWGNVAGLIAGLTMNDLPLIGRSLEDLIIEPERALLIPGFNQVKSAALSVGALGCSISGSGPSIFALSSTNEAATKISAAMQAAFQAINITATTFVSPVNQQGCKLA